MYTHILIPTDGSETAAKAIVEGVTFAREAQARVTFFTAVPEYEPPSESEVLSHQVISLADHAGHSKRLAEERFAAAAAHARAAGVAYDTDYVESNRPSDAIVEAAQRHGCDAIFMGSHGRRGLARLIHGSETAEVLSHSDIPTLVYR